MKKAALAWLPLVVVALTTAAALGQAFEKIDNLERDQETLTDTVSRSVANEAKIDGNVRLITNLGLRVERSQVRLERSQADVRRTQDTLNRQQLTIIELLRRQ